MRGTDGDGISGQFIDAAERERKQLSQDCLSGDQ